MKNVFLILITFLFSPFFYLMIILNKNKRKKSQLRILVIDTGKIGDLVCTTPVFREIKKKFPNSYLVVAIRKESYGIVQNNFYINETIFINRKNISLRKLVREINKKKFDLSINLSPAAINTVLGFWSMVPKRITSVSKFMGKTSKIFSFFNNYRLEYKQHTSKLIYNLEILKFIGINDFGKKKEVFSTQDEEAKAHKFLLDNGLDKNDFLVGISVTAGNKLKEWESEKFTQLADKLINGLKAKVIFIGVSKDEDILKKIANNMINKAIVATDFKLNELAALFGRLKIFISVDTGPLYIAHAVGTPVVDIVGPCDINEQPPKDNLSELVYVNIKCWPCSFVIPPARNCKEGHMRCLKETTPQMVYDAVKKLMSKNNYGTRQ